MPRSDDRAYYAHRLETSLRLAREASDPAIRNIHLKMAAEYRMRAAQAAEEQAGDRFTDKRVRTAVSSQLPVNRPRQSSSL